MSSLWTPYGEHQPEPGGEEGAGGGRRVPPGDRPVGDPGAGPPGGARAGVAGPGVAGMDEAEADEAEIRAAMARLAATPVADIIANHAIGLWQLAVLHLGLGGDVVPDLEQAALALDAMAALVDGLGDRLGENAGALRDALAQLRLAYVQVAQAAGASPDEASPG